MIEKIQDIAWLFLVGWSLLGLMFLKGSHIKWEWRDMWVGVFFGKDAIYVSPLGFLVFVFPKKDNPGL